ncbi:MAG: hypothetical protein AAFP86_16765, partial [Planctomycetota bacterium]
MLHNIRFAVPALLLAAAPLYAQSALERARVEVLEGRAVLIGGGADVQTVRRTETVRADGATQIELGAGSRVHVGFDGTLGLDVHGPASFQWSAEGARVQVRFSELGWADVEARRGEHVIDLPAEWRATIGRSSIHLRGIAGGPTELRLDAGQPAVVDWRGGGRTVVRPPVTVYPGSSVRLDQPRHSRTEPRRDERSLAWSTAGDGSETWPWRASGGGETVEELKERNDFDARTQSFDELPGSAVGTIDRVRTPQPDGSYATRELPRFDPSTPTYADGRPTARGAETRPQAPAAPATTPEVESTEQAQPTVSEPSTVGFEPRTARPTGAETAASTSPFAEEASPSVEFERTRSAAPAPELTRRASCRSTRPSGAASSAPSSTEPGSSPPSAAPASSSVFWEGAAPRCSSRAARPH